MNFLDVLCIFFLFILKYLFTETLKNHISNNNYQKKKFVFECNKDYFNNNYVKEFCGQTVVCHQQKQSSFFLCKLP